MPLLIYRRHSMNLEKLSNQEIQVSLARSVRKEKEGFTQVIAHLVEVERRKLYLQIGRRDLLEYLVKDHGYSQTAALQRITAMKEVKQVPEAQVMLEEGTLHMSQLTELARATKQKQ